MAKRSLFLQHLSARMQTFAFLQKVPAPPLGWIKTIRTTLGMSMEQLGKKLVITRQGVHEMEERELQGAISIKSLREVARVLDMQLVYGFVPNDGSLDTLIDRKAQELALNIVLRTSNSMMLEDQENTKQRIEKAIQERAAIIKAEMPKILWD